MSTVFLFSFCFFCMCVMPQMTHADLRFLPNVRVDDTADAPLEQWHPTAAIAKDGTIYVVWDDERGEGFAQNNIYLAKSSDNGKTFSKSVRVSSGDGIFKHPKISIGPNNEIYVVYDQNMPYKIFCARSFDKGQSFQITRVDDSTDASYRRHPRIELDPAGNIYVVWFDTRGNTGFNANIYFSKSTNNGVSFSQNINVNANNPQGSKFYPHLAVDQNNVYVVWHQSLDDPLSFEIYFSKSINGGATFGPQVRVSDGPMYVEDRQHPIIDIDPKGNIFVCWTDGRNWPFDIYLSKSTNGGNTFSANVKVNNVQEGSQENQEMAIDSKGNINIIFEEMRFDSPKHDIYLSRSVDGGLTFQNSIKVDDALPHTEQLYPEIALDRFDNIYAIWNDNRQGISMDIYLSKSITIFKNYKKI